MRMSSLNCIVSIEDFSEVDALATLDGNHAINEATNLLAVRENNELPRMHRGDLANTVDVGLSVVTV